MAAISQIIFSDSKSEKLIGTLIVLPAEFYSRSQMDFYSRCSSGWSRCPLGYDTFAATDSLGRKIVMPGFITPDLKGKRRSFPGMITRFSRAQIEAYLRPHLDRAEEVRNQRDALFRNLTHDLRAISTEIYHEAITARDIAKGSRSFDLVRSLDLVLSSQQMMSVRLDIIDYESGLALSKSPTEINVFTKVQKVFLCFDNKIKSKNLTGSLEGGSFSTCIGPEILEIVFFVILENAIKYSPSDSRVIVSVGETDKNILVSIQSWGPCVADREKKRIFEAGFRGVAAQRFSNKGGAGIGLYAAATIVREHFKGEIEVRQDSERKLISGHNFYDTTFIVSLPIHKKQETVGRPRRRISRSRRRHTGQ